MLNNTFIYDYMQMQNIYITWKIRVCIKIIYFSVNWFLLESKNLLMNFSVKYYY